MKKTFFFNLIILCTSIASFSQSVNYEVYAFRYASLGKPIPISFLVMDGPDKDSVNAVFTIWLIKGSNGKNILVDAGFLRDIAEAKDFGVTNYIRPDSMLLRIGLQAKDITDIILTHPHWDHMDGVDLFPNAHIWLQKEDFNYFVGTAWQKSVMFGDKLITSKGKKGGFNKRDVRKLLELNLADKLTLVEGDDVEIISGIKVYTGSRHTFNSQYVLVESGRDKIILASDNLYIYYNLEHLKSAAPNATFDTEGYAKSIVRMKALVSNIKFIIPGHDPAVFLRFPKIADGVVKIK